MEIESITYPFIVVFSFGMLVTSIVSYLRAKNIKLILVSLVFLIFFIKGIIMSFGLFYQDIAVLEVISSSGMVDLIVLICFYLATLKR